MIGYCESCRKGGCDMTIILFIGMLGVFIILFFKNSFIDNIETNNKLVHRLQNAKWFQNYWLSGLFLFAMNAILFLLTVLILYVIMFFEIPYVHLFIMFIATIGSIFLWIVINKAWQGTKSDRFKMGIVGSSFYIILTAIFFYWLWTLEPAYPGDDTFMGAIGLIFAIIVTLIAFTTCFVISGFSRKNA